MRLQDYINEQRRGREVPKEAFLTILNRCQQYLFDLSKKNMRGLLLSGRGRSRDWFEGTVRTDREPKDTPIHIHRWLDDWFKANFNVYARSNSVFVTSDYGLANDFGDNVYCIFPIDKYKIIWSNKITDLYGDLIDSGEFYWSFVENSDSFDLEDEWNDEYGEGEKGVWVYRNYESDEGVFIDEGAKQIADQLIENEDYNDLFDDRFDTDTSELDEDELRDEIAERIESYLRWEPNVTYEEYVERREEEDEKRIERELDTYRENALSSALDSNNEIMLICKNYIAINWKYKHQIIQWLEDQDIVRDTKELKRRYL